MAITATYFGEDLLKFGSPPFTNSLAAQDNFKASIPNPVVEHFESYASGTAPPLKINFSSSGASVAATLSGGGGVFSNASGSSNAGRFSVVGVGVSAGNKYWNMELTNENFVCVLSSPALAFGFFATDVSDFGGQLTVKIFNGSTLLQTLTVPHSIGVGGSTDGSCFFYGFTSDTPFTNVTLANSAGSGDSYGVDGLTVSGKPSANMIFSECG